MASGWDDEAVATRWKIATQTKLETKLMMMDLMAHKQGVPHGDGVVEVTWCVLMRCSLTEMFVGEDIRGNTFKSLACQKKISTIRFQRAVEERLWHLF